MIVVHCPHCRRRVELNSKGACPSCRRILEQEQVSQPPATASTFADTVELVGGASPIAVNENPYAAPQHLNKDAPQTTLNPAQASIIRLLFLFQGRIPRRSYWGAYLGALAALYAAAFVLGAVFEEGSPGITVGIVVCYGLWMWVFFAISAKRWHDRGKSAWWILVNFIPVIGGIWHFIEVGCLRGTIGPNQYGADPTGDRLADEFERLRTDAVSVWGDGEQAIAYAASQIADRFEECPWCEAVVVRAGDTRCAQCDRPV